ncbi:hypothetical protein QYE76_029554 [Lolium multiflorum]|uniref:Integrase zinc-binding domain-containing protein n=1 Tax=Lolium multiflorum TaxID=4521 RepID=A0AAD8QN14_LOLMU|nr:hypothetical protein QYE76_029554 [Lolium multiflorum]
MLVDSMDIDMPVFVVREAPSWVKPIKEFLINGTLPVDENESRRIQRRSKAYTIINGEVYKRSVTGVLQRCVEPEEGKEMLEEIHRGECGHHASSRALVAKVFRHGFYWPMALENAEDMVRKCNGCQRLLKYEHGIVELVNSGIEDKTLLDTTCSGSFTSNKEEFKRDLLDRIKENAEDWENDKGKESGYADKPPFKPLPPKEGNEENEEKEKKKKKKKKGTKKKKRKKKENKKKEVTAYPRVNEITLGNRKYVAPNDYCDNESEYDDLPMPFTYISDHDLNEHTTFDIGNLFGTDYESNDDSIIHVPLNDDIESSKLGDVVLEDPVFETSTFSENDDITYSEILVKKYSRNWTKLSPRVLFLHEASKTEDLTKWGHEEASRRAQPWPRRPIPWALVWPLALTLRLLKASVAKPPDREPRYGKPSRDAAAANPISGILEIASGTPGEGIHLPEDSTPPWSPPE